MINIYEYYKIRINELTEQRQDEAIHYLLMAVEKGDQYSELRIRFLLYTWLVWKKKRLL